MSWLKNDGLNPSASLKDRASFLMVAEANRLRESCIVTASTDTRIKLAARTLRIGGSDVTIAACICKGSGMIAPAARDDDRGRHHRLRDHAADAPASAAARRMRRSFNASPSTAT